MAYYIDIANSYSATFGVGTEASPWNWSQFTDFCDWMVVEGPTTDVSATGTSDILHVKGTREYPGTENLAIYTNIYIYPWDATNNGPWIVSATDFNIYNKNTSNCRISGGAFSNLDIGKDLNYNFDPNFYNCYFYDDIYFDGSIDAVCTFKGCTFRGDEFFIDEYSQLSAAGNASILRFADCVFDNIIFNTGAPIFSGSLDMSACICTESEAAMFSAISDYCTISADDNTYSFSPSATLPDVNNITSATFDYIDYGLPYLPARKNSWIPVATYTQYNDGFFGNIRKGPGAFYFMNTYYVDLSETSTGGKGTEADYFGFQEFKELINIGAFRYSDIMYLKGSVEDSSSTELSLYSSGASDAVNAYFLPWDLATNGPWRIRKTNGNIYVSNEGPYINFRNGIISTDSDLYFYLKPILGASSEYIIAETCHFDVEGSIEFGVGGSVEANLYGCTFISPETINIYSNTIGIDFTDCVFDIPYFNNGGGTTKAILDNCVVSAADSTQLNGGGGAGTQINTFTLSNIQYNWTPPTWPDWDGTQAQFRFSNLGNLITLEGSEEW